MWTPASSGASAFHGLPAVSREPTSPGIRGLSSQVRASPAHRSAGGCSTQVSTRSVGSHTGLPTASAAVASRPAAVAVSTSSAMVASSTCSAAAVALRSRTPRPPLRSADGGSAPHRSSSSSSRRTASNAAPAAARVDLSLAALGRRQHRHVVHPLDRRVPAAQREPDLAGHHDRAGPARHQQPAGEQLLGRRGGVRGQQRVPGVARWSPRRRRPGRARASPGPARTARPAAPATSAVVGAGAEQGRSPLTPASGPPVSPSATPLSGRSPPVDSQASARSTSRSIACRTRRRDRRGPCSVNAACDV